MPSVLRRGGGGVEVRSCTALCRSHPGPRAQGQTELAVLGPLIAAGLFRPGQAPGLFGKTVITQSVMGHRPSPPAQEQRRRSCTQGSPPYTRTRRAVPPASGRISSIIRTWLTEKSCRTRHLGRAAGPFKISSSLCGLCKAIVHCHKYRVAGHGGAGDSTHHRAVEPAASREAGAASLPPCRPAPASRRKRRWPHWSPCRR